MVAKDLAGHLANPLPDAPMGAAYSQVFTVFFFVPSQVLPVQERELFIDNLLVRIHFIIEMIWWTGLAPWEFEFPFPGCLISTFLVPNAVLNTCFRRRVDV